ncbi:hypothetical protein [Alkalicoccus daliensis]|uniref:Uncharacterized protein n=1 Tax=Alkalicoccus daliensis TaxID=745820 RepID=A0A1H0D7B4_9BACI|nr:hypothetical protein [Alkalicoccus daliensis]SDN66003.1 hypothetical protein SAMN04488053_102370 [Alkalicoccus daliensis]
MEILTGLLLLVIAVAFWIVGLILPNFRHADSEGSVPEKKLYKYGIIGLLIGVGSFLIIWLIN